MPDEYPGTLNVRLWKRPDRPPAGAYRAGRGLPRRLTARDIPPPVRERRRQLRQHEAGR